ncbi:lipid II flippase MurJ [Kitasatospora atroaurantiaca]|uniref:Putative peptidoglycan lipid II flippase n=1 Tax=Kitasatospora atroaurantiaca TaxID=285545 RepID=A0A561EKV4_9ACTN|nr:lipid II flippase MurJ [Kitasatospora atroaurantiaca]TWE16250.1 putative peptidoglycan lipid II flippase [Kitasatospora atroaurantiaca]
MTLSPVSRDAAAPEPDPVPDAAPPPPAASGHPSRTLARAFGITAVLSVAGSLLGLARDLVLARYFGAGRETDAFLVAWSVPETAAPLLIDSAMPLLMLPAFSAALASRRSPVGPDPHPALPHDPQSVTAAGPVDPVPALVLATLPRLCLLLTLLSSVTWLGAPSVVALLAPGLHDPALAVTCTRFTATTVFFFGLAGYLSAGLRAHQHFTAPAAVYTAYNTGILITVVLTHGSLGIRAAALGVAVGSLLMVVTVLPAFHRRCCRLTSLKRRPGADRSLAAVTLSLQALVPVVAFALTRQSQVYIERYLGSGLPSGTISHLNYAEKVAQMPMAIAVMISTITLPLIARAMAEGDTERARDQVEKDLVLVSAITLAATAFLVACAPQILALLFQHGAFDAADTSASAAVMRIFSLGLLGQALVGATARPFFSARPMARFADSTPAGGQGTNLSGWIPTAAMGLGLAVTAAVSLLTAPRYGAPGLAAGNAVGITLTAALLLGGLRARGIPVTLTRVAARLSRLCAAAACATGAALCAAHFAGPDPLPVVLLVGSVTVVVFGTTAWLFGVHELRAPLLALAGRRGKA